MVLNEDNYKHGIKSHVGSSKKDDILAFSDSNHASDSTNRKSYQGVVFLVQGRVIAYKSEKQKSVMLSTAKVEYCIVHGYKYGNLGKEDSHQPWAL